MIYILLVRSQFWQFVVPRDYHHYKICHFVMYVYIHYKNVKMFYILAPPGTSITLLFARQIITSSK